MKKIININFHSRVVPIEETAYEILQQYVESLRRYFANEEGRDEIISDIENRFAELFSETLKKGANCITDADVNSIIASMGKPEDFEQEDGTASSQSQAGTTGSTQQSSQQGSYQYSTEEPRRLYRADNDKILGGVCAGMANYFRLDPSIVRLIFVLITFGWGAGVLLYIVLWMVLPSKSLSAQPIRKRLYRNADDKVIAGVASGLAAYFHIEVWIPRLIFAFPLILSILTSIFSHAWFPDFDVPVFFTGSFGGTLFVTYIVLWIVLPEAVSASEKLEMRGEKVDLESIKNTIKSDLETFKGRAKEVGSEMQERFQEMGQQMRQSAQSFSSDAGPVIRRSGNGIGHAIGVLFKAFFLFIAGIVAFALIMALIGITFRGQGILMIKNYIISGFWQNILTWASFFLFFVIPLIALLTWLIRRITGVRSRSHYLGYVFSTLWIIGLFCLIGLIGMVLNNFRYRQHVEEEVNLAQPSHDKLIIRAAEEHDHYYDGDWWFDEDWRHNDLFSSISDDSLLLKTVRVVLLKSADSSYHVQLIKFSHGNDAQIAKGLAERVVFTARQQDSVLLLPSAFPITTADKFRNQQVAVVVAIPVGKRILINSSVENYHWHTINVNKHHIHWNRGGDDNWSEDWDDDDNSWRDSYSWNTDVEYVMTAAGLVRTNHKEAKVSSDEDKNDNDGDEQLYKEHKKEKPAPEKPEEPSKGGYRYHQPATPAPSKDTTPAKSTAMTETKDAPVFLLSALLNLE